MGIVEEDESFDYATLGVGREEDGGSGETVENIETEIVQSDNEDV